MADETKYDEFGIPIKQQASVEVDEFGIPLKKNESISGSKEVSSKGGEPQSEPSTVSGTKGEGSGAENKARYDKYKEDNSVDNPQYKYGKPILQSFPDGNDRKVVYGIDERMSQPITLGEESRQMGIAKGDVFGEIKVNAENAQKALEGINQSRYVRTKKLQEQTVAKQDQVFLEGKKIENLSSQIDFATNLPQYKELTAIDGQLAAMGEPKTKEQINAYNALVAKRDALLDTDVSQTDEYNATVTIPTFNMPSDDMSEEINRQNQIKDIVNKGKKSFEAKAAYEGKVKLRDVLGVADIKSKELSSSINKYKENAAQIDLNIKEMYNLNKDKLQKVGFTEGFFDGINQTTISNTLADLYLSGDDDQLGKSLENLYMEQATMPKETTVGGDIGTMIGGQVKPMAVSVTASALSPAVGVGAGALYYGRMGIGSGILDVYTTARSQGKTQAEALALAKKQAVVGGVGGVVEGLAGLVTAGGKPVASVVSKSFKEAVKTGLKEAQIDVVTAGLVAAGQNANIQRLGLDRKLHEGVIENMAGEAFFSVGAKVAITGGQKVKGYGTIVNTMAKAPFQDIQAIVDDAVKQGVANEANANQFIQDVQKSAKAQQKLQGVEIPEQSVDDVIDLQKQLDVLEEQKKTASPAALPAIEGKIEQLSSEIQIKAAIPLTAKEKAELNKLQTAKDSNTDYDKDRLKELEARQKAVQKADEEAKAEEAKKVVEAQKKTDETVEVELEPTVTQPKAEVQVKRIVEPTKPIAEMNSEELGAFASETRSALKKQDKEFEGKTEKEKEDGGYYDVIDDVEDLRDASQRINFVENAEDIGDLANSIKSVFAKIKSRQPNEYELAILSAAKRRSSELGLDNNELGKEVAKKIAKDYDSIDDAMLMVDDFLGKIKPKQPKVESSITFEGKRGQADSITFDGKTIKQGDEIELSDVNISQDDSMPDLRSGKYKVRMLSVDANGKTAMLTLTDGNEVITTTVKDLRKVSQPVAEAGQEGTTEPTQEVVEQTTTVEPIKETPKTEPKVEEKSIFETYEETKGASKRDKVLEKYAKENPEKAQRVREIIDNFEDMKTMLQTKIDNGEIKNLKIEC